MNLKALVTTLVLGSSSVALADHDTSKAPYSAPTVRDHRLPGYQAPVKPPGYQAPVYQAPAYQPPVQASGWTVRPGFFRRAFQTRPVLLANDTHLMGRSLITVPAGSRMFTKLELRSNNGRTSIDRVVIELGNGQRQVVAMKKIVNGKGVVTIDLPGGARFIKSITLLGNSQRRATIDVIAV